ncbi:hypothetical protein T440DRAFT_108183 [Plenodomus tracheiphilus IPT5]|uniref:C2H2-type domain-containing protein n=1 Tax=Plenodomus tracheiphilus IPT5 TaxID=1408161 RepID=A0A6A7BQ41_9PLEO|nr:hypothetical protein T440DRAFT_108183 [Plenodomus tracheiphilus IPT5]
MLHNRLRKCQCPPKASKYKYHRIRGPLVVTPVAPPWEFPQITLAHCEYKILRAKFNQRMGPRSSFWCLDCNIPFSFAESLHRHRRSKKHKEAVEPKQQTEHDSVALNEGKDYCEDCNRHLGNMKIQLTTRLLHRRAEMRRSPPESRRVHSEAHVVTCRCKTCETEFRTQHELDCHLHTWVHHETTKWQASHSKYTCDVCRRVFTSLRTLRIHLRGDSHWKRLINYKLDTAKADAEATGSSPGQPGELG